MMPMPRHGLAGAVVDNSLHLANGDIQSAGITGMRVVTESHDAVEFTDHWELRSRGAAIGGYENSWHRPVTRLSARPI